MPGFARDLMIGKKGGSGQTIAAKLKTNLLAYWKLDEASAGAAAVARVDSVGGLNFSDAAKCSSIAGILSNALVSASTGTKYLTQNDNAAFDPSGDFSVCAWAKRSNTSTSIYVAKGNGVSATAQYFLGWSSSSAKFRFAVSNGTTLYTVDAATFGASQTGTWYFLIGRYIAATGKIGICVNDGAIDEADSFIGGVPATAQTFCLGAFSAGASAQAANIDEVGLWGKLLSSAERTALYNGGLGRTYPFDLSAAASGSFFYPSSIEA